MSAADFIFGAAMIGGGVFVGVYGEQLFRFVLAVIGFAAGFGTIYFLLDSQSDAMRVLFGLIAGGIGAAILFMLVNFGLYIAGGVAGLVLGLVIAGALGFSDNALPTAVVVIAGAGGTGFFGRRLGTMIIPLATAAAAALMIVYGFASWFESDLGVDMDQPSEQISRGSLVVLLLIIFALSFLAQWNIANLRRRLLNR